MAGALAALRAEKPEHPLGKYVFSGKLTGGSPFHIFCSGCGYGIFAQAITRVFVEENLDEKKYPFVIGIGCYSGLPTVLPGHSTMVLHGRPIAVATGMKLANPELKPIVITGDGDCLAIGAGHFLHACRRNVDIVAIMLHNNVYGMTGGQSAPTLPYHYRATTAPYGFAEQPFDPVKLAISAGATFVARWTTIHVKDFIQSFKKALLHKGFSLIDLISTCHTYFGRKNRLPEPIDVFRWIRDNSIYLSSARGLSEEELRGKFVLGEFKEERKVELSEAYRELIEIAGRKK